MAGIIYTITMISRPYRFHGHNAMKFVLNRGQTVRGQHVSLKYARNVRRDTFRASVVVSRKVHKSAVVRNRIRRRVYEIVRRSNLNDRPYDLVFFVYSENLATIPAAELQQIITQLLVRGNLLSGVDVLS